MLVEKSMIKSKRLGLDAYRKVQGKGPGPVRPAAPAAPKVKPTANHTSDASEKPSAREFKATVIKSLHARSNSGMVNMRDVALVLDRYLKRP